MARVGESFRSDDLNKNGRAVLDAARAGSARLVDEDGTSLVLLPEVRLSALKTLASYAATFLTIEHARAAAQGSPLAATHYGEWAWMQAFDEEDLSTFIEEVRAALIAAAQEESLAPIEETIERWRITASVLEDGTRRGILLGVYRDEDFVEVGRPEQE